MRVLVSGSREWSDPERIRARLAILPESTIVIHGGARGADLMAEDACYAIGLTTEVFPADWDKYGKRAGYIRNAQMLDTNPNLVIAFWDGSSPGTSHTIKEAQKRGIPVEVVREPEREAA